MAKGKTIERPENVTSRAMKQCAEWLCYCLSIGWTKSDLDALEYLWWMYHDRTGLLKTAKDTTPMNTTKEQREDIRTALDQAALNGDWETPAAGIPALLADAERAAVLEEALQGAVSVHG